MECALVLLTVMRHEPIEFGCEWCQCVSMATECIEWTRPSLNKSVQSRWDWLNMV